MRLIDASNDDVLKVQVWYRGIPLPETTGYDTSSSQNSFPSFVYRINSRDGHGSCGDILWRYRGPQLMVRGSRGWFCVGFTNTSD